MAAIPAFRIPTLTALYERGVLLPPSDSAAKNFPKTLLGPNSLPTPDSTLNGRVGFLKADITKLAVGAIVNAANTSLLGGGGVDGAIHRAAGEGLYDECSKLGGCETGSAKMTNAYKLPCEKVIHAVGPIYHHYTHDESEELLTGCYTKSLELAAKNQCRTIAFSALSTGIYGYPSELAAPAALSAIRRFLLTDRVIQKVVIVAFVEKDVEAYKKALPLFFPPPVAEEKPAHELAAKQEPSEGPDPSPKPAPPEGADSAPKSEPTAAADPEGKKRKVSDDA
ncbi:hypothetical protein V8F20_002457 [Naviculisporaceae sp. PSN 640]